MLQGVAEADPRRAAHLARLTAALISGGALPLSVLKVQMCCLISACCVLQTRFRACGCFVH